MKTYKILQGNSQLNKLHKRRKKQKTYFNSPVAGGGNDVFVVEIDHVDGGPMSDQYPLQGDVSRRIEVPHSDRAVLGTGDHDTVLEAQMEDSLAMVNQRVQHLACFHVPNPVRFTRKI